MKKLLGILVLGLLLCNIGFAEEIKRPEYSYSSFNYNILKYKWKHTGSFKGEGAVKVMTLKKDQWILYCAIYLEDTECWLP